MLYQKIIYIIKSMEFLELGFTLQTTWSTPLIYR